MEAIVSVIVVASLGLLAVRFGADSRDGLASTGRQLAAQRVTWAERVADLHSARDASVALAVGDSGPTEPATMNKTRPGEEPRMPHRYPTLTFIERGSRNGSGSFASSAHAAHLEQRARLLVDELWSETVWATGLVSDSAFHRVHDALERERIALDRAVTVLPARLPFIAVPITPDDGVDPPARVA